MKTSLFVLQKLLAAALLWLKCRFQFWDAEFVCARDCTERLRCRLYNIRVGCAVRPWPLILAPPGVRW